MKMPPAKFVMGTETIQEIARRPPPQELVDSIQREYESLQANMEDARNAFFKVCKDEPETNEDVQALSPQARILFESWIKASEAYAAWEEQRFNHLNSLKKE